MLCTGEFGRTPFQEGRTSVSGILGRDHYPDCYSFWMAGGGVKPGYVVEANVKREAPGSHAPGRAN